jgi:hypothetical protein
MVLHHQPVNVDPTRPDRYMLRSAAVHKRVDLEGFGSRRGHHRAAHRVHAAGLDAAGELRQPFVPVGVQLDAALLHHDAEIVVPGIEGEAAAIEAHVVSPFGARPRFANTDESEPCRDSARAQAPAVSVKDFVLTVPRAGQVS